MKSVQLKFLDKEYSVTPNFRTISAIESMTGRGTMEILHDLGENKVRMTDMIHVVYCMMSDPKMTVEKVANEVIGKAVDFVGPIVAFLNACSFGSEELAEDVVESKEKND